MTEDRLTTVAFTGHRTYGGQAAAALRATVGELYARGFRTFLCGMAMGFDLAAAEAVLACRDSETGSAFSPATVPASALPSAATSAAAFSSAPDSVSSFSPASVPVSALSSAATSAAVVSSAPDSVSSFSPVTVPASTLAPAASSASAFPAAMVSASAFSPAAAPDPHFPHTPMPGLRLVAVIPFRGQESRFPAADRERFRRVLAAADHSVTLSPSYHAGCYAVRNNYLVEHAALLVAWYDGSPGGTHYTVRRALGRGLEFINLHPHPAALRQAEPTLF
ncbi:SLOG family protein [Alistipes finegoldii]|uniref:SLOG family protein n=1 Tax=Alistipes finegoldii TaxID=214856 RepID=UPI0026765068|nr:SLOG family protein [Alistipes finegoldii]